MLVIPAFSRTSLLVTKRGGEVFILINSENGAQAGLVESFQEMNVTAMGDQGFRAVKKGGHHNGAVDADLSLCFKIAVVSHPLV